MTDDGMMGGWIMIFIPMIWINILMDDDLHLEQFDEIFFFHVIQSPKIFYIK
jgi:hypothetical protein